MASPKTSGPPIVLHLDYDCFYASVIENENPALKHVPLGIQQKNILATCNYAARARGVKKLCLVSDARKICSDLVIVNGEDLTKFRDVSKTVWMFVREYIWGYRTERLGLDEIFIDCTEMIDYNSSILPSSDSDPNTNLFFRLSRTDPTSGFNFTWTSLPGQTYPPDDALDLSQPLHRRLHLASHLASFLRSQILERHNHTCSAGISTSKLCAKLAGSVHKPNQQTLLHPSHVQSFLDTHEVGKIPGIGFKIAQRIREAVHGVPTSPEIEYTHEVANPTTVEAVRSILTAGKIYSLVGTSNNTATGRKIWGWLHGNDDARVGAASVVPTQISIEDTFRPGKLTSELPGELTKVFVQLVYKLLQRMHTDLLTPVVEDKTKRRNWIVYPKNFRLSVRFHKPRGEDGKRELDWARNSKSCVFPGFALVLDTELQVIAERLVKNIVSGLFRALCKERKWELQLVNVAAVNMTGEGDSGGRRIDELFAKARASDVVGEGRDEPLNEEEWEQDWESDGQAETENVEMKAQSSSSASPNLATPDATPPDLASNSWTLERAQEWDDMISQYDDDGLLPGPAWKCSFCPLLILVAQFDEHSERCEREKKEREKQGIKAWWEKERAEGEVRWEDVFDEWVDEVMVGADM